MHLEFFSHSLCTWNFLVTHSAAPWKSLSVWTLEAEAGVGLRVHEVTFLNRDMEVEAASQGFYFCVESLCKKFGEISQKNNSFSKAFPSEFCNIQPIFTAMPFCLGNMMKVLRGHPNWVYGCAFSPDSSILCSVGASKAVCVRVSCSLILLNCVHNHFKSK